MKSLPVRARMAPRSPETRNALATTGLPAGAGVPRLATLIGRDKVKTPTRGTLHTRPTAVAKRLCAALEAAVYSIASPWTRAIAFVRPMPMRYFELAGRAVALRGEAAGRAC